MLQVSGNISLVLLILTGISAFIKYPVIKGTPLVSALYYIWVMILVELVAAILSRYGFYNLWLYIISSNAEVLFFLYIFYRYIRNKSIKRLIWIGGLIFEIVFIIEYLVFFKGWVAWPSYSLSFGYLIIILFILYFFMEMFKSDKILYLHKHLIFWVTIGILFYLTIALPLNITLKIFFSNDSLPNVYILQLIANFILYISFLIGLIWNNKPYNL
jgi:hypothetical protein